MARLLPDDPRLVKHDTDVKDAYFIWNEFGIQRTYELEDMINTLIKTMFRSGTMLDPIILDYNQWPENKEPLPGSTVLGGNSWTTSFYTGRLNSIIDGIAFGFENYFKSGDSKYDPQIKRNIINIGEPPSGLDDDDPLNAKRRSDLIFLEIYKIRKLIGHPIKLNGNADGSLIDVSLTEFNSIEWRIRCIPGVDFSADPTGMTSQNVTAMTPDGLDTLRNYSQLTNDSNQFVCGTGSSSDKLALGTSDGYIRAIPLYKVYRRNSSPYNEVSNPNGGSLYTDESSVSDRPDGKFSNVIYSSDLIIINKGISLTREEEGSGSIVKRDDKGSIVVPDPIEDDQAASKGYVDSLRSGFSYKEDARVASIEGGSINISVGGLLTIDGVQLNSNDRVLLKNQVDKTQNGIYKVSANSWIRSEDADTNIELIGSYVNIIEGVTNSKTSWILKTSGELVLGTTELVFAKFNSGQQLTFEHGLVQEDNVVKVKNEGITDALIGLRIINQAITTAYSSTGLLTQLLSWFAKTIKGIKGDVPYWYSEAPATLSELLLRIDTHDHDGTEGNSVKVDHANLESIGTLTHGQIETFLSTHDHSGAESGKKLGTSGIEDDAITDELIGSRTIDQSIADATSNTGNLTQLLSFIIKEIKAIKGAVTNWSDSPSKSISELATSVGSLQNSTSNIGESLGSHTNETSRHPRHIGGSTSFNTTVGVTITHNLGHLNYRFFYTPTANTQGYLGEVWIIKSTDNVVVYNSGSSKVTFDYIIEEI